MFWLVEAPFPVRFTPPPTKVGLGCQQAFPGVEFTPSSGAGVGGSPGPTEDKPPPQIPNVQRQASPGVQRLNMFEIKEPLLKYLYKLDDLYTS